MRVHSHDGEPEERRPQASPADPAREHLILQLQRSAGNAAVARQLLLRNGPGTKEKPVEQRWDEAIAAEQWDLLAAMLATKSPAATKKLATLTVDQLRELDDGARRVNAGPWLRTLIKSELVAKGVGEPQTAPGMGYGTVSAKETIKDDGDPKATPKKRFQYRVEVSFAPTAAAVDADEIAFVQTARIVDLDTGDNASPYGQKRMTLDHTKVDRLSGAEQGYYGMEDDGSGGITLKPWVKGSKGSAWMRDTPKAAQGNRDYTFETAVVCSKGKDVGMVYATVTWGFTVDADLKLTSKKQEIWNKPTDEFGEAVDAWNAQAKGPRADRNAPGQKTLPPLR